MIRDKEQKYVKLLSLSHLSSVQRDRLNTVANLSARVANIENYNEDEVINSIDAASIILINHVTPVTEKVLLAHPQLRYIVSSTIGTNHIDLEACHRHGVRVRWFPGFCARTLAEHSFAYILMGLNRIVSAIDNVRSGHWDYMDFRGREARGRHLLVMGLGNTGKYVKEFATAFGMKVSWTNSGTSPDDLNRKISEADVISLHMALNEQTRKILNRDRINRMKSDVVIVNTARGALIDEPELWDFLEKNSQALAILDVLENEPPIKTSKAIELSNVVLTPHMTWNSEEASSFLWAGVFDALLLAIEDKWPSPSPQIGWL